MNAQEQALLELVHAWRDGECAKLLAAAQREAQELRGEAHREARRRLHRELEEARREAHNRVAAAEAHLRTLLRQQRQRHTRALLGQAWRRLEAELMRRWEDAKLRRSWLERAAQAALGVLSARDWRIFHPAAWEDGDAACLRAALAGRLAAPPQFHADAAIAAGIRIVSGNTTLDATLAGLLADRAALEARLLAHLEPQP